jgi:hypothetical protein
MTISLYMQGPLLVVSQILPSFTPVYAIADRILRYTRSLVSTVTQVTQSYVPRGDIKELIMRINKSLFMGLVSGCFAAIAYLIFTSQFVPLISDGTLEVPLNLSLPLAATLVIISISSVMSFAALPALGLVGKVAVANVFGACIGCMLMLLLGQRFGGAGIAISVVAAELTILIFEARALITSPSYVADST